MKMMFEFYDEGKLYDMKAMEDTPENRKSFVDKYHYGKYNDNYESIELKEVQSFIDGSADEIFVVVALDIDPSFKHGIGFRVISLEDKIEEIENQYKKDLIEVYKKYNEEGTVVRQVISNDISPI